MSDRILQLCKRLNKFTLDKIVTISEIPEDKLLPVLNKLIIEFLINIPFLNIIQKRQLIRL